MCVTCGAVSGRIEPPGAKDVKTASMGALHTVGLGAGQCARRDRRRPSNARRGAMGARPGEDEEDSEENTSQAESRSPNNDLSLLEEADEIFSAQGRENSQTPSDVTPSGRFAGLRSHPRYSGSLSL